MALSGGGTAAKGCDFVGASVTRSVSMNGHYLFHFDENLTQNGPMRLGASSWRVLDITQDRVLVAPASGEPGRMPFWRGDGPGRPLEFGRAIGALVRRVLELPRPEAIFDKQPLRDYLAGLKQAGRWDGNAPGPDLPDAVVRATSERYVDAFRRVTGHELPA